MYIAFTAFTVALGLVSRIYRYALPDWLAMYAGDTLWGLCVFLAWSVVVPGKSVYSRGLCAVLIAWGVEISQLYQAEWIQAIRATTAGSLVLGHGFVWSDLVCYAVGVGMGMGIELMIEGRVNKSGVQKRPH